MWKQSSSQISPPLSLCNFPWIRRKQRHILKLLVALAGTSQSLPIARMDPVRTGASQRKPTRSSLVVRTRSSEWILAAAAAAVGAAKAFWGAPRSRRWWDATAWPRLSTPAFGCVLRPILGFDVLEALRQNRMLAVAAVAAFCADAGDCHRLQDIAPLAASLTIGKAAALGIQCALPMDVHII